MTAKQKSIIWKLIGSISGIIAICSMLVYSHKVMITDPAIDCKIKPIRWMLEEVLLKLDEGMKLTPGEKRNVELKLERRKRIEGVVE